MLPILQGSYEDTDLAGDVPVIGLGKQVFKSQLHACPMTPLYSEMSASIARVFNRTLTGELTGAEATQVLDRELRAIVVRNR